MENEKSLSDWARQRLLHIYNNHDNKVGSQLKKQEPEKYKDFESTDCITYVLNVLEYAFNKKGNTEAAKQVWLKGSKGTNLARYLVDNHNWKGIYINPDVSHPKDKSDEHTYTAVIANKKCEYYRIPVSYKVTNYNTTSKTHPSFQKLNKNKKQTPLDSVSILSLENVKFGFGISRGGMHTWLYSKGKVYEVHWDSVGDGLFEEISLRNYSWLSGAIFIPSAQASLLTNEQLKCG
ncbi:hypothetical protein [Kangiella shandongensis]|uniref:hypothetical protein n=1 Tax=Kangiella shandongensis TaxID=2763258 RepID=UPI001CBB41E8|nr:hypothetical protein [Kangiella shandongensis]